MKERDDYSEVRSIGKNQLMPEFIFDRVPHAPGPELEVCEPSVIGEICSRSISRGSDVND